MPTQDTLNITIKESNNSNNNNNAPIATESFPTTWRRLFLAHSRRHHDAGEDEIERGENKKDLAKGTLHVGDGNHEEHAEAGATPLDGPETKATNNQHHSPFSSTAFDQLPQPVPVVDIFFGSWWFVLALRTATRPVVIYFSLIWMWTSIFFGFACLVALAIYLFRWVLLRAGRDTVPLLGVPIPGKRQLFWVLFGWIQKIWVSPPALLKPRALLTSW